MKDYMKAMLGMAYKAANPPVVIPQQQAAQNQMAAGVASIWPPAPQFEENVPEDELEFEGKLSRWPLHSPLLDMQGLRRKFHGIDCCQRCLML